MANNPYDLNSPEYAGRISTTQKSSGESEKPSQFSRIQTEEPAPAVKAAPVRTEPAQQTERYGEDKTKQYVNRLVKQLEGGIKAGGFTMKELSQFRKGYGAYMRKVGAFRREYGMDAVPFQEPTNVEDFMLDPYAEKTAMAHIQKFENDGIDKLLSDKMQEYQALTDRPKDSFMTKEDFRNWFIENSGAPSVFYDKKTGEKVEDDPANGIFRNRIVSAWSRANFNDLASGHLQSAKEKKAQELAEKKSKEQGKSGDTRSDKIMTAVNTVKNDFTVNSAKKLKSLKQKKETMGASELAEPAGNGKTQGEIIDAEIASEESKNQERERYMDGLVEMVSKMTVTERSKMHPKPVYNAVIKVIDNIVEGKPVSPLGRQLQAYVDGDTAPQNDPAAPGTDTQSDGGFSGEVTDTTGKKVTYKATRK